MELFSRFNGGQLHLTRVEAFSDGVFAIILTLLVLDLKVPVLHDRTSVSELAAGLWAVLPKFLSWLISFIIVCKFWLNHHHVLSLASHANYALVWINSLFLMFQSFVPFPTSLMGEYPENALAVSVFGCVMAVNTMMFMWLNAYVLKNLMKPELAGTEDPHILLKSWAGPLSYLLGAACAWWNVHAAFVVYGLTPLFFITPPAAARTRRSETGNRSGTTSP
ncbi:MAG TPA: TMEM175 family protein [Bryobacteraceae bacterium]|jgi:uncharacterized membrane protein